MGRLAGFCDDQLVSLQQAEQLHGGVFASPWHTSYARCLGNVVGHGNGDSAEGLYAFGQCIDKLRLLAEVLIEEKVELVKRRPGDLPMMFFIHVAQGHCVGENLIEAAGAGQANLVIER